MWVLVWVTSLVWSERPISYNLIVVGCRYMQISDDGVYIDTFQMIMSTLAIPVLRFILNFTIFFRGLSDVFIWILVWIASPVWSERPILCRIVACASNLLKRPRLYRQFQLIRSTMTLPVFRALWVPLLHWARISTSHLPAPLSPWTMVGHDHLRFCCLLLHNL